MEHLTIDAKASNNGPAHSPTVLKPREQDDLPDLNPGTREWRERHWTQEDEPAAATSAP